MTTASHKKVQTLRIPGLPTAWRTVDGGLRDLSVVPEAPSGPHEFDPQIDRKRADWLAWGSEIVRYRTERILATEGMLPGVDANRERGLELLRCQFSSAYFVTVWCHLYETRAEELKNFPWYRPQMQGWLPFIPFPYQVALLQWLDDRLAVTEGVTNGAMSKARDMGATDTCCRWALHGFLFRSPFHAKFISRKEELVDQIGNLDSMIERIASGLVDAPQNMALPNWMLPDGWTQDEHRKLRLISQPGVRNMISGESTSAKSGRGGRASIIFIDEAAFIKDLKAVMAATQATAPHVIALSSESVEESDTFVEWRVDLQEADPAAVIEIDYWEHLFHDQTWLERMKRRYLDDEDAFAREVLRDAEAGFGGWMYPDAKTITIIDEVRTFRDHDHAYLYLGIDPGLADETAVHWVMHDPVCGRDTVLTTYETTDRQPAEYIAAIICGVPVEEDGHFIVKSFTNEGEEKIEYDFYFPPHTRDLMEWIRMQPEPRMIFGDPYGFREHATRDDSWYARMSRFWARHNPRPNPVTGKPNVYPITVNWLMDARGFQGRRQALHRWLRTRLDFSPNRQAELTLEAIQKSRWDISDRPRQTEQKDAKHDKYSHRRAALEYIAVNLETFNYDTRPLATDRRYRPGSRTRKDAA